MTMLLSFLSAVGNVNTSSSTCLICVFSSVSSLELYYHHISCRLASYILRTSQRRVMNIGWGVLTLLNVGIDRLLHTFRVRRLSKSHGPGQRGWGGELGAPLLKDSRTTHGTNSKRSAPPTWAKTRHPNFQAAQAGSWEASLPASRRHKQSQSKDLMLSLQQTRFPHGIADLGLSFVVRSGTRPTRSLHHVDTSRALTRLSSPSVSSLFYYWKPTLFLSLLFLN